MAEDKRNPYPHYPSDKSTTPHNPYNQKAVQEAINKDKRISAAEGKKIHAVLKGWRKDASSEEKLDAAANGLRRIADGVDALEKRVRNDASGKSVQEWQSIGAKRTQANLLLQQANALLRSTKDPAQLDIAAKSVKKYQAEYDALNSQYENYWK